MGGDTFSLPLPPPGVAGIQLSALLASTVELMMGIVMQHGGKHTFYDPYREGRKADYQTNERTTDPCLKVARDAKDRFSLTTGQCVDLQLSRRTGEAEEFSSLCASFCSP